ncbi:MAG: DUF4405 domain-containing protein [Anaerolineae bacterium]|nr:DUF4405 domain-containing protein [Anaerolineae bacterium]
MTRSHHINTRALVALVMLCSFVVLPFSGIALHFASSGSFSSIRHLLMTIHNLAAAIFLISALLHLKLNWKPLTNYLKLTTARGRSYRTEFATAFLIVAIPLILGTLHVFALGVS